MAIRVELQLVDGQFVTRMMHAGESVRQFNANLLQSYPALRNLAQGGQLAYTSLRRTDEVSKGFLATLRDISIVAGVVSMGLHKIQQMAGGLLGSIVKVNSEFENMTLLMKAMSQPGDKFSAEEQVRRLREEAAKAPFSLQAMQDAATKLKSTGFDPLNGSLNSLMDAVAAVGGTDEKLNRVVLAITQMSGKGVIQMEELRQQLGEALPMATELMARSMGLTMSELIQKISTGTVAAKPALQGLMLELDRTFGGQAEQMMQTFSGQVTRTTTLLQGLALKFGEMDGASGVKTFYGEVKNQLNDMNNFLASDFANNMADSLNIVLVEGIQTVRWMIDGLISMRHIIGEVGEKALWAFGIFMGGKLVSSMASFFTSSIMSARALSAQYRLVAAEIAAINVQTAASIALTNSNRAAAVAAANVANTMLTGLGQRAQAGAIMANSVGAASVALTRFGGIARGIVAFLPVLASGFAAALPIVALLGLAIYSVAEYFDLFGNKARNAWQELEKFGATSLQQIQDASGVIDNLQEKLKRLRAEDGRVIYGRMGRSNTVDNTAEIAAAEQELAEKQAKLAEWKVNAEEAEAERGKAAVIKAFQAQLDGIRSGYQVAQKDQREAYEKQRNEAIAGNKDTESLQVAHRQALLRIDMGYYDKQLEILKTAEEQTKRNIALSNGTAQAAQKKSLDWITEQINQTLIMRQQMQDQGVGLTQLQEPTNLEKSFSKGQTALDNIKQSAEGLREQLSGGTREAGELAQVIESGLYGPAENTRVQTLIDDLLLAQQETDALKEALDAVNDGQSLYDSTISKLRNEHLDFVTKDKGIAEAYQIRQQAIVDGLSPQGKIALMMQDIRERSEQTRSSILELAKAFTEKLFGSETQNGGNTMLGMLDRMASKITGMVAAINKASSPSPMGMSFTGSANYNLSSVTSAADLIKKFEGFISSPKWDVNAYRAGYGSDTTTTASGSVLTIQPGMTVTLADADRDLVRRVGEFQADIISQIGSESWNKLDTTTQQALTSVAYNYGSLPDNVARAVKTGSKEGIAASILARRDDNGGINANRRAAEANFVMSGNAKPITAEIFVKGPGGQMLSPEQQLANIKKELAIVYGDRVSLFWQDIDDQLERIKGKTEEGSEAIAKLKQSIREGQFGDSEEDRNPESEKYKSWYLAVEKVIAAEKKMKEQRQAGKDVDSGIEENIKRIEAQARALQQADQEAQRNPFAKRNEDIQQIIDRYDELIRKAKEAVGGDASKSKSTVDQLLAQRQAEIDLYNRADVTSTLNTLRLKEEALREGLGTERQIREEALRRELAELDAYARNFEGSKEDELRITSQVESAKAALIEKYGQQNAGVFADQMRQWQDMTSGFQQSMASAMTSVADGITNMLMGEKVEWNKIMNDIVRDIVGVAVRGMMGNMMGGTGKAGAGVGNAAGSIPNIAKKMLNAGVKHTGGVVGVGGGTRRSVSPMHFMGAPRFHTGGIIGSNEVPIIAQKGEGVFTPEQMKAMGTVGARATSINTTINVTSQNGGGDGKGNDDLAKKIAKEVETSVRGIVFKEMREQMRPGNSMSR